MYGVVIFRDKTFYLGGKLDEIQGVLKGGEISHYARKLLNLGKKITQRL